MPVTAELKMQLLRASIEHVSGRKRATTPTEKDKSLKR